MTIEKPKQEKIENSGVSRREFLKALGIAGASALCFDLEKAVAQESETPSRYGKDGWFFTPEKMKEIYEQEYNGEKILRNLVFKKDGEWFGLYDGKEFKVPQEFFDITLLHLKAMLEQKVARYLFRLDAFHGHFFVPEDKYSKYAPLKNFNETRLLVEDKNLGILYHNSEHLKPNADLESAKIHSKRNVIGWYNGRPIEILPLPTKTKSTAESTPGRNIGLELKFAANKDGEFSVIVDEKEIRLDFSFDDNSYF